jgi:dTDP-4-amino-4,6-dideoxygalactose transaminase
MSMLRHRKLPFRRLSSPKLPLSTFKEFEAAVITGRWDPSKRVEGLEHSIGYQLGVPPACVIATRSCTDALAAAWVYVLPWQSTVSVTAMTYAATFSFQNTLGGELRFVDVDNDGWPTEWVEVGVDLWGRPFPVERLGYPVVLDAAHRVLAPEHGQYLTSGRVSAVCYSFNVQKEIPCICGGALVLQPELEHLREDILGFIRSGTLKRKGVPGRMGIKGYMPDPVAAWISMQQKAWKKWQYKTRQLVLEEYENKCGNFLVTRKGEASGSMAVIRFATNAERELVRRRLQGHHVETSIHYEVSEEFKCPNATDLAGRILTVPCHAAMVRPDVMRVSRIIMSA